MSGRRQDLSASLGRYQALVDKRLESFNRQGFSNKLWTRNASLWKSDPEIQMRIKDRLGWMNVVKTMAGRAGELKEFVRSVRGEGFTDAVLLGMGGSSLCPEVCRLTFGRSNGYPDLKVLDSTDPATIIHTEKNLDLAKTVFIVASKSGTTLEVQCLQRYFYQKLGTVKNGPAGGHFIAITDPGTSLDRAAREQGFCKIFLNPPDIGGRYSALSYFGLVPAALIGIDPDRFLDRAEKMVERCGPGIPAEENPGIRLGAILGELGKAGRDKITLIGSPPLQSFGLWVEQLVAESTGKEGKGLVPIEGEEIGPPEAYGQDRLFIFFSAGSPVGPELEKAVRALESDGHPVVRIHLEDALDLAGEFFRWEVATAVAGAILEVNPFDEPNVTESKENSRRILDGLNRTGRLPPQEKFKAETGEAVLKFLKNAKASDYVALLAYLERSESSEKLLQEVRSTVRDRFRLATTLGYGPRFLHSTGQLHKGGPPNGLFLQITADDREDIPVPGEKYTFGTLKKAQALGDFGSLINKGRRAFQIHLGQDIEKDLKGLEQLINKAR
jgi:glucose-6-phosphate isomerase